MPTSPFEYAFEDSAGKAVKDIIHTIPGRWGRMPPLSRAVVVETGVQLRKTGLLDHGASQAAQGRVVGLIGGSRWGSYVTDRRFAETLQEDVRLASPAIFSYTLANIPLAEAANQFGLTGPVYAIIDQVDPLQKACCEAKRLLNTCKEIDIMLACEFDAYYDVGTQEQLSVTFIHVDNS